MQDSTGLRASLRNQSAKDTHTHTHTNTQTCLTQQRPTALLRDRHLHIKHTQGSSWTNAHRSLYHTSNPAGIRFTCINTHTHTHTHHLSGTAAHYSHRFSRTSHCSEARTQQPLPASQAPAHTYLCDSHAEKSAEESASVPEMLSETAGQRERERERWTH